MSALVRRIIFHTYSTYGRGAEELVSAYVCLDLTPKGRNETGPGFNLGDWVRHHDRYDRDGFRFYGTVPAGQNLGLRFDREPLSWTAFRTASSTTLPCSRCTIATAGFSGINSNLVGFVTLRSQ
jgi:hypothetical protein